MWRLLVIGWAGVIAGLTWTVTVGPAASSSWAPLRELPPVLRRRPGMVAVAAGWWAVNALILVAGWHLVAPSGGLGGGLVWVAFTVAVASEAYVRYV